MNLKLKRLLAIVFFLLNRDKISAQELSEKFQVSVRTIYRDIKIINQAGIPILTHSGAKGGFSIMENYKIDKQVLSVKEMHSIVNALKGVNASLDNSDLELIIEKICALLPKSSNSGTLDEGRNLAIDLVPWGMSENHKKNIRKINIAIENKNIIKFLYTKAQGEGTERYVEPMTIFFKSYAWYLFGYCRLRHDFRIFKISRIKKLDLTDLHFVRKKEDYQKHLNWEQNTNKIHLKLKFSKTIQSIVEDNFPEKNIFYHKSGDLIVTAEMPKSPWVYGFVLSYGSFVEVLEPLDFRESLKKEVANITKLYNN